MSDLIAYIKAENAEVKAKQAANPGSLYSLLLEDASWWADRGVLTVDDYKRWEYTSVMSDLAKEAYGTRSMCPDINNMSLAELKAEYNIMANIAEQNFLAEQAKQKECIAEFETAIENTIAIGAGDRETAIAWLRDNDDGYIDDDYFEYCNNLPYGYLNGHRPG
jgi:hypothetical protein